jgi:hypothetical protein
MKAGSGALITPGAGGTDDSNSIDGIWCYILGGPGALTTLFTLIMTKHIRGG